MYSQMIGHCEYRTVSRIIVLVTIILPLRIWNILIHTAGRSSVHLSPLTPRLLQHLIMCLSNSTLDLGHIPAKQYRL